MSVVSRYPTNLYDQVMCWCMIFEYLAYWHTCAALRWHENVDTANAPAMSVDIVVGNALDPLKGVGLYTLKLRPHTWLARYFMRKNPRSYRFTSGFVEVSARCFYANVDALLATNVLAPAIPGKDTYGVLRDDAIHRRLIKEHDNK